VKIKTNSFGRERKGEEKMRINFSHLIGGERGGGIVNCIHLEKGEKNARKLKKNTRDKNRLFFLY
jgi:hypothetical protein